MNDPGTINRETAAEEITRRNSQLRVDPLNPVHFASRSGPAAAMKR